MPKLSVATSVVLLLCLSCGNPRLLPYGNYHEENVTVVGTTADGDGMVVVSRPGGSGGCVKVSDDLCVDFDTNESRWCERSGGPMDVVIVDGEVQQVICYPPAKDESVRSIDSTEPGDITVLQTENDTTIVFNDSLDGQPIEGDLVIEGNQVAVYGNGPDATIIDGNVSVSGNNVRLRGLTITGDLTLTLNTAAVVGCRILGDVKVTMNGAIFVANEIFGSFTANMHDGMYVGNDVQGEWNVSGHNNTCDENRSFVDANANKRVDEGERGDQLACG